MLETIINYSLRRRGLVMALTLVLAGSGCMELYPVTD